MSEIFRSTASQTSLPSESNNAKRIVEHLARFEVVSGVGVSHSAFGALDLGIERQGVNLLLRFEQREIHCA
jgi:hypothetical protein